MGYYQQARAVQGPKGASAYGIRVINNGYEGQQVCSKGSGLGKARPEGSERVARVGMGDGRVWASRGVLGMTVWHIVGPPWHRPCGLVIYILSYHWVSAAPTAANQ